MWWVSSLVHRMYRESLQGLTPRARVRVINGRIHIAQVHLAHEPIDLQRLPVWLRETYPCVFMRRSGSEGAASSCGRKEKRRRRGTRRGGKNERNRESSDVGAYGCVQRRGRTLSCLENDANRDWR